MKTVFRITKPPPSTNNLYINVKRGRIRSQQYEDWIQWAGVDYMRQRPKQIKGPVNITIEVQEPKRHSDIDNRAKAPLDFLVKTGVIEADDQTIVRKLNLAWSDEIEGCRVTIESIFSSVASELSSPNAAGEHGETSNLQKDAV